MANGRLNLTRDQLATFLKDHQLIKQFEQLFTVADSITPDVVNEVSIAAEIAGSRAQQALDTLQRIANALDVLATAPAVVNEAFYGLPLHPTHEEPVLVPDLGVAPPSREDELFEQLRSLPQLKTQVATPAASGFSVTVVALFNGKIYNIWLLLKPTAAFAAGTIVLPAVAECIDQQEITVSCTQQVTALTVNGSGATVAGAPAALAVDSTFKLRFNLASTTWHSAE